MNIIAKDYVSKDMDDLKKEAGHSEIIHVALCPYEARTVIAQVAVLALRAMQAKDGKPVTEHERKWDTKMNLMIKAFELLLSEDWRYELPQEEVQKNNKIIEDGLMEFAAHFESLWL